MKKTKNNHKLFYLANRKNKKAQGWVSDYTISIVLFIIALTLSAKIVINSFSTNTVFEEIKTDAAKISEILLSEGFPSDWHNASVIRPGLLTNGRLNSSKVFNAMNMSYATMRTKVQTNYDFLVIFEEPDKDIIEFNELCVIGNPYVNINSSGAGPLLDCHTPDFTSIAYTDLVKITRFTVYDTGPHYEIIRMVVYVWNPRQ